MIVRITQIGFAIITFLGIGSIGLGQGLQQQEAERLARERQSVDQDVSTLAKNRAFLEREKAELQKTFNSLQFKTLALAAKIKQLEPPSSAPTTIRYYNGRVAMLQAEREAIDREARSFNVRNSQFQESVRNFNYRLSAANSRLKRYNDDVADYNRRYSAGYGSATAVDVGTSAGGGYIFDDSLPNDGN